METNMETESDPRSLLRPEAVPILHSIVSVESDDDDDSAHRPSTVDIAELIGVGAESQQLLIWRSTSSTPKARPKVIDTQKKDNGASNGREIVGFSEESQEESQGSSSAEDSDSNSSSSGSGSSSNSSSDNSSDSSSCDTDSDDSNQSSSGHSLSRKKIQRKTSITTTTPLSNRTVPQRPNPKSSKNSNSASSSSTSSRDRKSKKSFSISQSNYEPGCLKLKIAALNIPGRRLQEVESNICSNDHREVAKSSSDVIRDLQSTTICNSRTVSSLSEPPAKYNDSLKLKSPKSVNCNSEKGGVNFQRTDNIRSHNSDSTIAAGVCTGVPGSQTNSSSSLYSSNNLTATSSNPVINNLGHNVTVTLNNGSMSAVPKDRYQCPSAVGSYSPTLFNAGSPSSSDHQQLDPVYRLHKNSDLTIFPIVASVISTTSHASGASSSRNADYSIMSSTMQSSQSLTCNPSSGRTSKRVSSHRRSTDKIDELEWDSAETDHAVSQAILAIDSTTEKCPSHSLEPFKSRTSTRIPLLDKVTEGLKSSESPIVGDLSIQRISISNYPENKVKSYANNSVPVPICNNEFQMGNGLKTIQSRKSTNNFSSDVRNEYEYQRKSISPKKSVESRSSSNLSMTGTYTQPKDIVRNDDQHIAKTSPEKLNKTKNNCLPTLISPKNRLKSNGDLPKIETSLLKSPSSPEKGGKSLNGNGNLKGIPVNGIKGRKRDVSEKSIVNGVSKEVHSVTDRPPTMPIRTKAAKKIIPDDIEQVPQNVFSNSIKKKSHLVTKTQSSKTSKKKSKKLHKERRRRRKQKEETDADLNETCEKVNKLLRIDSSVRSPRKIKKTPEIFRKIIYKPQSFSFGTSPLKSSKINNKSPSSQGRKRKLGQMGLDSSPSKDIHDSENSSPEVHRLPLKKRHHNVNSSFDLSKELTIPVHIFGSTRTTTKLVNYGISKELMPTDKSNYFQRLGEKKGKISFSIKTKVPTINPQPNKKQHNLSPDITEQRRSGRVRKPKKLDLDEDTQSEKSAVTPTTTSALLISPTKIKKSKKIDTEETVVESKNTNSSVKSPKKRTSISTGSKAADGDINDIKENEIVIRPTTQRIKRDRSPDISDMPIPVTKKLKIKEEKAEKENIHGKHKGKVVSSIPILVAPSALSLKVSPPSASPQLPRKRRKVNRTGFPSTKRKKKPAMAAIELVAAINAEDVEADTTVKIKSNIEDTPASSDNQENTSSIKLEEIHNGGGHASALESTTTASLSSNSKISTNAKFSKKQRLSKEVPDFTPTLTERVKMRKRASIDGFISQDQDDFSACPKVPGIIPALLDVQDPPIIVPIKTNYLPAGLLSNHYKVTDISMGIPPRKTELLPKPCDPESEIVVRGGDAMYKLPFDIWCLGVIRARNKYEEWKSQRALEQRTEDAQVAATRRAEKRKSSIPPSRSQLKPNMPTVIPPSWTFKKIKQNSYYGVSKPQSTAEAQMDQLCNCPGGRVKCETEECLNRLVYTECPSACGEQCLNRRIQKHNWAPGIKRFLTAEKGYGVKTTERIQKGDFILEYVGEVVSEPVFKERMHTIYATDTHHYCLHLDGGLVIDGHRAGGEGRFVNHSCEPNCEMQKWSVNGLSRMALFALRDIQADEELSYDYNFTLFNEAEGQPCHCGSTLCRGVIGVRTKPGKSDVNGVPLKKATNAKTMGSKDGITVSNLDPSTWGKMKSLSRKDRCFIRDHCCFLIRNYDKIRKRRSGVVDEAKPDDKLEKIMTSWAKRYKHGSNKNKAPLLPESDKDLAAMVRICQILYEVYMKLTTSKDENGSLLCNEFMGFPSKRKSLTGTSATTSETQTAPFNMTTLGNKILKGDYKSLVAFENDLGFVLTSSNNGWDKEKPLSKSAERVKYRYKELKSQAVADLEPFIVTQSPMGNLPKFQTLKFSPEEMNEIIRCICGCYDDEGTMIQCDKCLVWQHCDCMRVPMKHRPVTENYTGRKKNNKFSPKKIQAKNLQQVVKEEGDTEESVVKIDDLLINVKEEIPVQIYEGDSSKSAEDSCCEVDISEMETQKIEMDGELAINSKGNIVQSDRLDAIEHPYYCEECLPRKIDLNIPIITENSSESEKQYFKTLLREDGFMVRRGDHVYVLRDYPPDQKIGPDGLEKQRLTYLTAPPLDPEQCDIFRIENIWIEPNKSPTVHGFHYLRPKETFHEPNRRFFPNEIVRSPMSEYVPIELIHGRCWVVDPTTYCKGRPADAEEKHVYICEFRVDKGAKIFNKIGKTMHYSIKPFSFKFFETRLKIQRNVHPHGPPSPDFRIKVITTGPQTSNESEKKRGRRCNDKTKSKQSISALQKINMRKKKTEQKDRLYEVLEKMRSKIPGFALPKDEVEGNLSSRLVTGRKKTSKKF